MIPFYTYLLLILKQGRVKLGWILILTLSTSQLWVVPSQASQASPCNAELLTRIEKFYSQWPAFEANFQQEQDGNIASGKLWYQQNMGMRWNYKTPHRQLVVTNNDTVWLHDPLLESVLTQPLSAFTAGTQLDFLLGIPQLRQTFTCLSQRQQGGLTYLQLESLLPLAVARKLEIGVAQSGQLRVLRFFTATGIALLKFEKIKVKKGLAKHYFTFKPPKGSSVITPPTKNLPQ